MIVKSAGRDAVDVEDDRTQRAVRFDDGRPKDDELEPRTARERDQQLGEIGPVLLRDGPARPHEQGDAVGLRSIAIGEPRACPSHRDDGLQAHPPERGVAGRLTRPGRHDGHVAHLGQGEQPVVLGVVARHPVEQVHVLHRGQAGEVEVLQPPQLEVLGQHGVQVAVEAVLDEHAVGSGAVGEVLGAVLHVALRRETGDRHVHAPERTPQVPLRELRDEGGRRLVAVGLDVVTPAHQVDDWLAARIDVCQVGGDRRPDRGYRAQRREDQDDMDRAVLVVVVRAAQEDAVHVHDQEVADGAGAVPASGADLEKGSLHVRVVRGDAAAQQRLAHRLGGLDQGVDPLRPLRAERVLREGIEMGFHARLRHRPARLHDGLIDEAEPSVACEVGDVLQAPLGRGRQPVVAVAHRIVDEGQDAVAVAQSPFKDLSDDACQLRQPGLGAEEEHDGLLEVRVAVQVLHAVVGKHAAEPAAHPSRHADPVGVQPLHVAEQVLARGESAPVRLPAGVLPL